MKPEEIRKLPLDLLEELKKIRESAGDGSVLNPEYIRATYDSATHILLAEIAAQLAELNGKIMKVLMHRGRYM